MFKQQTVCSEAYSSVPSLIRQSQVLNSELKEVTNLETANVTQSMDYACPTSNMSTVNTASTSFTFLGILSGTFNTDVDLSGL